MDYQAKNILLLETRDISSVVAIEQVKTLGIEFIIISFVFEMWSSLFV